jgi:hypothetical protein
MESGERNMASVRAWLAENGFEDCADAFEREHITIDVVSELKDDELILLGLTTIGQRHRFRACAETLASRPTEAAPAPDGGFQVVDTSWLPPFHVVKPMLWIVPLWAFVTAEWRANGKTDLVAAMVAVGLSTGFGALHLRALSTRYGSRDSTGIAGFTIISIGSHFCTIGMVLGHAIGLAWRAHGLELVSSAVVATMHLFWTVPALLHAILLGSLRRAGRLGRMIFGALSGGSILALMAFLRIVQNMNDALSSNAPDDASEFELWWLAREWMAPVAENFGGWYDRHLLALLVVGVGILGSALMLGLFGSRAVALPLSDRARAVRVALWWEVVPHAFILLGAMYLLGTALDAGELPFSESDALWVLLGLGAQLVVVADAWRRLSNVAVHR